MGGVKNNVCSMGDNSLAAFSSLGPRRVDWGVKVAIEFISFLLISSGEFMCDFYTGLYMVDMNLLQSFSLRGWLKNM